MPSKLDIFVSGVPDGSYMTVIVDPSDATLAPLFAASIGYISGVATTGNISPVVGTAVTGFAIDNLSNHANGAVITGTTVEGNITTKVIFDFSSTANSHCTLSTDSVLTTSYKLGISTVLPLSATTYALFGRASSANDYFKILSTGYLSLDVDGTVVTSTTLATIDSKFREYSVTLSGNDFIFRENTTVISTVTNATAAAKTLTLNLIANSNGANFYAGPLSDAALGAITFPLNNLTGNSETVSGVTLTYQNIPTSSRDTYSTNNGVYLGSNSFSVGGIGSWTDNGNGTYTSDPNDGTESINGSANFIIGETYEMSIELLTDMTNSGQILAQIGSAASSIASANDPVGTYTITGIANVNFTRYFSQGLTSGESVTVGSLSVKRKIEVA